MVGDRTWIAQEAPNWWQDCSYREIVISHCGTWRHKQRALWHMEQRGGGMLWKPMERRSRAHPRLPAKCLTPGQRWVYHVIVLILTSIHKTKAFKTWRFLNLWAGGYLEPILKDCNNESLIWYWCGINWLNISSLLPGPDQVTESGFRVGKPETAIRNCW